ARGEQQRVALKDGESFEHAGEAAVEQEFVTSIMANPGQVPGELPRGDRDALIGKRRDVALQRGVEVELPLLVQQCHGRRGDRLGHAPDAELRLRRDVFFFSSRRRHTRWPRDWSSDVCSSDLADPGPGREDVLGVYGEGAD